MIFGIDVASMLLGGLAAGMVLFIVSVGLSVTMGLMGFANLAHGATPDMVTLTALATTGPLAADRFRASSTGTPADAACGRVTPA